METLQNLVQKVKKFFFFIIIFFFIKGKDKVLPHTTDAPINQMI